jgi:hypothetical protein
MLYVALNINGWLNGTICRFLTKAEKAIWGDFIALGGSGEGRIGYIEEFKHIPYNRAQLLDKTHCFTEDDIKAFDSCYRKCLEGVEIGGELDKARISLDEYGCIKIENWDTYQHSDYPQGYTEAEAKALKKQKRELAKATEGLQIDNELNSAQAASDLAKKALQVNPHIARRVVTDYDKKMYGKADGAPTLNEDTGELKDTENNE